MKSYFDDLWKILTKDVIKDTPTRIWNMDESGFHLEHTPSSIVARKGTNVSGRVPPNRENITVVACINVAGVSMPPMFIVKDKTPKSLFAFSPDDGPSNSIWTYQAKVWMEDVLAVKWFREIFLKWCGPERPQILIMDQHHSPRGRDCYPWPPTSHVSLAAAFGQRLLWPPYKALQHSMFAIHVERPKLYGV